MRSKTFSEKPLSQRRAYLKAAEAFFKPRLKDHFADAKKKVEGKPA